MHGNCQQQHLLHAIVAQAAQLSKQLTAAAALPPA
jgi:hypothetical protein